MGGAAGAREALRERSSLTDEDGMRLGELEGIVGEEGGYTAESDAAVLLAGLDIPEELHERKMGELQGGQKVRVLLAQALFGNPGCSAARRADEPPRSRLGALAAGLPPEVRRLSDRDLARSPLPERSLHARRRHRLRNDHHVHRRLRRHGAREDADSVARRSENAQREKKIAQLNEFIARFSAGTRSSQVTSRKKEVERLQRRSWRSRTSNARSFAFEMKRPSGRHPLEIKSISKSYDDVTVIQELHGEHWPRREDRADRPQRRR